MTTQLLNMKLGSFWAPVPDRCLEISHGKLESIRRCSDVQLAYRWSRRCLLSSDIRAPYGRSCITALVRLPGYVVTLLLPKSKKTQSAVTGILLQCLIRVPGGSGSGSKQRNKNDIDLTRMGSGQARS
jgi:hypothetical protein